MSNWTGPIEGDLSNACVLLRSIPPERTPFCDLDEHESGCSLRLFGLIAGSYCDCDASDESGGDPDDARKHVCTPLCDDHDK